MGLLSRDQILEAKDRFYEEVEVEHWGGSVRVQNLTAKELDDLAASMVVRRKIGKKIVVAQDNTNFRAKLVARAVVNEEGNLLFDVSDVEALGRKCAHCVKEVAEVARRLSGFAADEDVEDEEEEEAFDSAQSEGPTTS